jgi:hypothetical protein
MPELLLVTFADQGPSARHMPDTRPSHARHTPVTHPIRDQGFHPLRTLLGSGAMPELLLVTFAVQGPRARHTPGQSPSQARHRPGTRPAHARYTSVRDKGYQHPTTAPPRPARPEHARNTLGTRPAGTRPMRDQWYYHPTTPLHPCLSCGAAEYL